MNSAFLNKLLLPFLLTVALLSIAGCQNGDKSRILELDSPLSNAVLAAMGETSVSQRDVLYYLQPFETIGVTRLLEKEGGFEEVVKGLVLRKNIVNRAISENWLERPGIKMQIVDAQWQVLYQSYLEEKSEQLPANYPDDAAIARIYEDIKEKPSVEGKTLQEVAPLIRLQLRNKQQQVNQKKYINGLISSNQVNVDINKLINFVSLPQDQWQYQADRLKEPVASMGAAYMELDYVLNTLNSLRPAERQKLVDDSQQLQQYVARLMTRGFVVNKAMTEKFNARPDINNKLEQTRMHVIYSTYMKAWSAPESGFPDAEQVENEYQEKIETLLSSERYHLATIHVSSSGDPVADAEKANLVADAAREEGAYFPALARNYSDKPGVENTGGDIGWIDSETLAPEIMQALAGNQPGSIIGPLQYAWGWQIVKLIDHQPARQKQLEEARPELVADMIRRRTAEKEKEIMEQLLAAEPITVDKNALRELRRQLAG